MDDLLGGGFFFLTVAVYTGGAAYIGFVLRSVFLESGGYAHFSMVGAVLTHPFHTQHHFIIVAHAHGFYDVAFQVIAHGTVQPAEPIGLVGEDARQRQDNEYGNVFQRQFHGSFFMLNAYAGKYKELYRALYHAVRLNNTSDNSR